MTLQQVLNSIDQFGNNLVQIIFTNNRLIPSVLQVAYEATH
jgi:hypothetical protein